MYYFFLYDESSILKLHKNFKINPDMAVYGKALGNGYAISSIIGKKKYLQEANKSFISSTSWTEKVGFSAALQTIKILKTKNFDHIKNIGKILKKDWIFFSKKNNIKITINNYESIPSFYFDHGKRNDELYTIFTNFFLKKNILATNAIYLSFAHNKKNIKKYRDSLDAAFKYLNKHLNTNRKILKKNIRKYNY